MPVPADTRPLVATLRDHRQAFGIEAGGRRRDPTSLGELKLLCLRLRDWIAYRNEELLNYWQTGRDDLRKGIDYTQDLEAIWYHVARLSGDVGYPPFEVGPYPRTRAVAALDRLIQHLAVETAAKPQPSDNAPGGGVEPAGDPPAPAAKRRHMPCKEANEEGMRLAKRMGKRFYALSISAQAREIGCSFATWKKTKFFQVAKQRGARMARPTHRSPPVASFGRDLEAVTGEGGREEVLERLTAEQEADHEPSPVEPDPPGHRPKQVHCRKRL
jgi:hypothetical protein